MALRRGGQAGDFSLNPDGPASIDMKDHFCDD
jgi:hypothetical protein